MNRRPRLRVSRNLTSWQFAKFARRFALQTTPAPNHSCRKRPGARNQYSADYFNLLGVLHEAQNKWRHARRFYEKAVSADQLHQSAHANIRRLQQLRTCGVSQHAVKLGDESDEILYARLPDK